MSAYSKNKTVFKDRDCLVTALGEMGYKQEMIELHEGKGSQLIDYCGRPTKYLDATGDKANVIVRRKHVGGAANDLGFKLEEDGTYSAIVSAYDTGKHNTKWMTGLKAAYGEAVIRKTASKPIMVNGRYMSLKPVSTTTANGVKEIKYILS